MGNTDFVITKKTDKSVTMSIRIDESMQQKFELLANETNRSRNEVICMALQFALDNLKVEDLENK